MKNKIECPICKKTNVKTFKDDSFECKTSYCKNKWKNDLYYKDEYDENKFIDARGDIIIAKGGDGTLLKAINKFRYLNKPFFGKAAGTENFLMNSKTSDDISENAKYKKFKLIKVEITYLREVENSFHYEEPYEDKITFQAFNDVMIGSNMNAWIDFNVHDKDKIIGSFKGGGIIISTAQGSTGINKNNNGVILPLGSHNWSITGDKVNRRINYVIKPHKTRIKFESRNYISVWIDGQTHNITDPVEVVLSKGDDVTVIFNDYDEFKRKRRI